MKVEAEVILRERQHLGVNQGGVEEFTAPGVCIRVAIHIIALTYYSRHCNDLAVQQRLLPGEFGKADPIHAGPDAGGISQGAEIGFGRFIIAANAEASLGFDLG